MLNVLLETIKAEVESARLCFPVPSKYLEFTPKILAVMIKVLGPKITIRAAEMVKTILDDQVRRAECAECVALMAHLHCARGMAKMLCVYLEKRW